MCKLYLNKTVKKKRALKHASYKPLHVKFSPLTKRKRLGSPYVGVLAWKVVLLAVLLERNFKNCYLFKVLPTEGLIVSCNMYK